MNVPVIPTVMAVDAVNRLKQAGYTLCGKTEEIEHFLSQHPFLEPLLNESGAELKQRFNADLGLELKLELYHDPEDGTGPELFVEIITHLDAKAARLLKRQFIQDWWFHQPQRTRGILNFNLIFLK